MRVEGTPACFNVCAVVRSACWCMSGDEAFGAAPDRRQCRALLLMSIADSREPPSTRCPANEQYGRKCGQRHTVHGTAPLRNLCHGQRRRCRNCWCGVCGGRRRHRDDQ